MTYREIRQAFEVTLSETVGGRYPIAYENARFEPSGETFIKASFLPIDRLQMSLSPDDTRIRGIFQVDIFVPIGGGTAEAGGIAWSICQAFKPSEGVCDGVRIIRMPEEAPAILHKNYYQLPINIRFEENSV